MLSAGHEFSGLYEPSDLALSRGSRQPILLAVHFDGERIRGNGIVSKIAPRSIHGIPIDHFSVTSHDPFGSRMMRPIMVSEGDMAATSAYEFQYP